MKSWLTPPPNTARWGHPGNSGRVDEEAAVTPLSSQGSLSLSQDKNWLFAVNAGSGTLSVFRLVDSSLILTDQVATEGAEPVSVSQNGNLVYVLNAAGSSSV